MSKYLTAAEVAEALAVHPRTVKNMAKDGRLPPPVRLSYNLVRFRRADVARYLAKAAKTNGTVPAIQ